MSPKHILMTCWKLAYTKNGFSICSALFYKIRVLGESSVVLQTLLYTSHQGQRQSQNVAPIASVQLYNMSPTVHLKN